MLHPFVFLTSSVVECPLCPTGGQAKTDMMCLYSCGGQPRVVQVELVARGNKCM